MFGQDKQVGNESPTRHTCTRLNRDRVKWSIDYHTTDLFISITTNYQLTKHVNFADKFLSLVRTQTALLTEPEIHIEFETLHTFDFRSLAHTPFDTLHDSLSSCMSLKTGLIWWIDLFSSQSSIQCSLPNCIRLFRSPNGSVLAGKAHWFQV